MWGKWESFNILPHSWKMLNIFLTEIGFLSKNIFTPKQFFVSLQLNSTLRKHHFQNNDFNLSNCLEQRRFKNHKQCLEQGSLNKDKQVCY